MTARLRLFNPKRELVCECGWRFPWDWTDEWEGHALDHAYGDLEGPCAVFHVEIDGQATDRKPRREGS